MDLDIPDVQNVEDGVLERRLYALLGDLCAHVNGAGMQGQTETVKCFPASYRDTMGFPWLAPEVASFLKFKGAKSTWRRASTQLDGQVDIKQLFMAAWQMMVSGAAGHANANFRATAFSCEVSLRQRECGPDSPTLPAHEE